VVFVAVLVAVFAAAAGTAHADPPAPTDYLSRVVSIEPAVPGIAADMIGGDSFFRLTVTAPVEVIVLGYQSEPYLRFLPGGDVDENELAPTTYLNVYRYTMPKLPAEADATAPPRWRTVASGGTWVWHDHRTHWMTTVPPPDKHPGDQILESAIELRVDGNPVTITVTSTWMPAPSDAPALLGLLVGLVLGICAAFVLVSSRARESLRRWITGAAVVGSIAFASIAASIVGLSQTWSLPAATGPPRTAWALPITALAAALVGSLAVARHWSRFAFAGVVLVAAAQLATWSTVRRAVLDHAILPTNAPFWFDRSVTAGVGAFAVAIGLAALGSVGRMLVAPARAVAQPSASM